MQIKELLLGIPILFFVFWVATAPLPQDRISRVCEPIHWLGNLATSTTALSTAKHTETSARWSDKFNYSCQYLFWRLFYQDDYNKALEAGLITVPASVATPESERADPAENAEPTGSVPQKPETPERAAAPGSAKDAK